jgi:uncharacterized protein YecA (UPF0149 family)
MQNKLADIRKQIEELSSQTADDMVLSTMLTMAKTAIEQSEQYIQAQSIETLETKSYTITDETELAEGDELADIDMCPCESGYENKECPRCN